MEQISELNLPGQQLQKALICFFGDGFHGMVCPRFSMDTNNMVLVRTPNFFVSLINV
jgi:hypothetical protein